jgi:hypothetical protein
MNENWALEWIIGITFWIIVLYLIYPAFSKAKTKKGAALELTGNIVGAASHVANSLSEKMKLMAIENEFNHIGLVNNYYAFYSSNIINLTRSSKYKFSEMKEITPKEVEKLLKEEEENDKLFYWAVFRSDDLFEKCKRYNIKFVRVNGSSVYDATYKEIKKSKLMGNLLVGDNCLENIVENISN